MNAVLLTVAIWYGGVLETNQQIFTSMLECLNVSANIVYMLDNSDAIVQSLHCERIDGS